MDNVIAVTDSKAMIQAGWDHVPHLTEKDKREVMRSTLPHLRQARTQGKPSMGAGAIYPIDYEDLECQPVQLQRHWKRCYALDVGWKRTAAMWLAHDPGPDIVYAYTEHYRGEASPIVNAASIKARGEWIPGVVDPSARQRTPKDGERLLELYEAQGLKLTKAQNAVDSGLIAVLDRLETGRLRFFRGALPNFQREYGMYRRDENGKIVKAHDHLMDCLRYGIMSGLTIAKVMPVAMLPGMAPTAGRVGDRRVGY